MLKLQSTLAVGVIGLAFATGASAQAWQDPADAIDLNGIDSPDADVLINLGFTRTGAFLAQNGRLVPGFRQIVDLATVGGAGFVEFSIFGDTCLRMQSRPDPTSGYDLPGYSSFTDRVTIQAFDVRDAQPQPVGINRFNQGASTENIPARCDRDYAPVATSITRSTNEDVDLAVNIPDIARDPDGLTPTIREIASTGGTFTIGSTQILFRPTPESSTTATFDYEASDGGGISTGRLTVTITAINDPPVASENGTDSTNEGVAKAINVLQFVTDRDTVVNSTTFNVTVTVQPPMGQGTAVAQADDTVLYTPLQGFTGPASFTYQVTDAADSASFDTGVVTVTVIPAGSANIQPTARFAPIASPVADTNGQPGENVPFNGTGSCAANFDPNTQACVNDGSAIVTYTWTVNGIAQGSGATPTLALLDGDNDVALTVTDNGAPALTSPVFQQRIIVTAPVQTNAPLVNVTIQGGSTFVGDTDGLPGERRSFTGSATDPDNAQGQQNIPPTANSFAWSIIVNDVTIQPVSGQGTATAVFDLPDGQSEVNLQVTDDDGEQSTRAVLVNVENSAPPLEDAALTPNERSIGAAIDILCPRMAQVEDLTEAQQQLLGRCSSLKSEATTPEQQRAGLDAILGEEITAQQTTGIDFSRSQIGNLGSRLSALRQGVRGVSVAGLNINHDGKTVPLAQFGEMVRDLVGGAAGDESERDLLGGRLGIFINGSLADGEKESTVNESGFDFEAQGVTLGVDYRFTDHLVFGFAAGWNDSETEFVAAAGGIDGESLTGSLYGSYYAERFYLDLLASYGQIDYDSTRNVVYTDSGGSVNEVAVGETDGTLRAFGLSMGYDVGGKGWSLVPTLAINQTKVKVDGFAESGTTGLDLVYGDQDAKSTTAQGGVRIGYNFSAKWGVISPQVRGAFVKEFENDAQTVNIRFVNDPFIGTPEGADTDFVIVTDVPDEEYIRWGASLSAVFAAGISAFVDYESVASYDTVSAHELTAGVRFEIRF